ncbi:hypothetical protein BST16_20705 [Mycobacterium asiaticum DSM 44297]|nr:hypothetical protein BST16_20705 [Mycobacterium asiaticum DSM 44297]
MPIGCDSSSIRWVDGLFATSEVAPMCRTLGSGLAEGELPAPQRLNLTKSDTSPLPDGNASGGWICGSEA